MPLTSGIVAPLSFHRQTGAKEHLFANDLMIDLPRDLCHMAKPLKRRIQKNAAGLSAVPRLVASNS
ncbi:unnamed protein product, partial [Larinioides sclopetarius]